MQFRYVVSSFFTLALILVSSCSSSQIQYVTDPPKGFSIPLSSQPVYLVVTDGREVKTPGDSGDDKESEATRKLETNPEVAVFDVVSHVLVANGVPVAREENSNVVEIVIKKFDIKTETLTKRAEVKLQVQTSGLKQIIESSFENSHVMGGPGGVKILSRALSDAIDKINWEKHFPE